MNKEKNKKIKVFGYHMLLDFHKCSKKSVQNIDTVYHFLDDITRLLKMKQQAPPFVKKHGKIGLSAWVPIVESGISVNTNISDRYVSIDIYSCKEFDKEKVLLFASKVFSPKSFKKQHLLRGKEYVSK